MKKILALMLLGFSLAATAVAATYTDLDKNFGCNCGGGQKPPKGETKGK